MASGLNKVMLIGNLGKDAETRQTPSGTSVSNFTLATSARIKDAATGDWKDKVEWHNIVLWRGDRVAQYLTKGKRVFIEGRLQTSSWESQSGEKRYRTEVVCDSFGLMLLGDRGGPGEEGGGGYRPSGQGGGYRQGGSGAAPGGGGGQPAPSREPASSPPPSQDDDDIPF